MKRCDALGGRAVEVINFGVSGYGTAQQYLTLKTYAAAFSPDVVVLQYFASNDRRDNHRALSPDKARPFFTLHDGQLVLDNSFLQEPRYLRRTSFLARAGYSIINASRVLQLVNAALNEMRRRQTTSHRPTALGPAASKIEDPVFAAPKPGPWFEAWKVTEALIAATKQTVESLGAKFVLMSVSTPEQVHPSLKRRADFARLRGVDDLLYSERRLAQLADIQKFAYLGLAPRLQRDADELGTFFHGFSESDTVGQGHWNVEGHKHAGRILAQHICATLTSTTPVISPSSTSLN